MTVNYQGLDQLASNLLCELTCARAKDDSGNYFADVPEVPLYFVPYRGTYAAIAAKAKFLNDQQINSGFMLYVFAPEPVQDEKVK